MCRHLCGRQGPRGSEKSVHLLTWGPVKEVGSVAARARWPEGLGGVCPGLSGPGEGSEGERAGGPGNRLTGARDGIQDLKAAHFWVRTRSGVWLWG